MSWRSAISQSVRELRFQISQTSNTSAGVRAFLQKNYGELKAANPRLPILVRERQDIERPRVVARLDFGKEVAVDVANASDAEVERLVKGLVESTASSPRVTSETPALR